VRLNFSNYGDALCRIVMHPTFTPHIMANIMEPQKQYEILRPEDLKNDDFHPGSLQVMKRSLDYTGDRVTIPIVFHNYCVLPDVIELFADIDPSPYSLISQNPYLVEPPAAPDSYLALLQKKVSRDPDSAGVPIVLNFTVDQTDLAKFARVLYQVWINQTNQPAVDNSNCDIWSSWVVLATLEVRNDVYSRRKAEIFFNREEYEILSTAMADLFAKNSMAVEVLGLPRRPQPPQA
jgi:hypothetical protein